MGSKGSSGRPVRKRNESVTCETVHALYSGSSACRRAAETLEALLEQMTSALCFIHHYHKASLSLPFRCAHSRAHRPAHMRLYLHLHFSSSLSHTHTHACAARWGRILAGVHLHSQQLPDVLGRPCWASWGDPSTCREPSGSVMNCCSPGSRSARHIRVCERVLAVTNELRKRACVPAAFMSAQLQIVWLFIMFAGLGLRLWKHVLRCVLKSSCPAKHRI